MVAAGAFIGLMAVSACESTTPPMPDFDFFHVNLEGRVLDADDAPVPDVEVELEVTRASECDTDIIWEKETLPVDEDGRFSLMPLEVDSWIIATADHVCLNFIVLTADEARTELGTLTRDNVPLYEEEVTPDTVFVEIRVQE